ncbi:nucleolar and coiled-body phosphoprotein 1 isoform X2 [Nematostella vectensis]|uniref:nucleolar and coiled-body phosphoprotein 1 isoform X2 n=1 Tax=Nematostella vectensis TaxID=45351 RepID=UPI00138FCBC3|nr:nucleolar and coiled-body phosphoprotein 1 isoform X2 [Nematostella vectensis]
MAEGSSSPTGLKSSLSANDIDKPLKKPGKLSLEFLSKFESDPALPSGAEGGLAPGSSGDVSRSTENVKTKTSHVRISLPEKDMSSQEEVMSEDEQDDKHEKKRRSRWKLPSWKRVRKFFSRKKNPKRTKSCEDLPEETYKPIGAAIGERSGASNLRYRAKSDPMLGSEVKKRPASVAVASVHKTEVARTVSMPPPVFKKPDSLLKELKNRQGGSHENMQEEEGLEVQRGPTKAASLPTLYSPVYGSFETLSGGAEGAVDFDTRANTSVEKLQAAHDKIKVKPKHRRPPSRVRTSSQVSTEPPIKKDPTHHKRSTTLPKDLKVHTTAQEKKSVAEDTILEGSEEGSSESSPSSVSSPINKKSTERKEDVMGEIMSDVDRILSETRNPPKLAVSKATFSRQSTEKKERSDSLRVEKKTTDAAKATENTKTPPPTTEKPHQGLEPTTSSSASTEKPIKAKTPPPVSKKQPSPKLSEKRISSLGSLKSAKINHESQDGENIDGPHKTETPAFKKQTSEHLSSSEKRFQNLKSADNGKDEIQKVVLRKVERSHSKKEEDSKSTDTVKEESFNVKTLKQSLKEKDMSLEGEDTNESDKITEMRKDNKFDSKETSEGKKIASKPVIRRGQSWSVKIATHSQESVLILDQSKNELNKSKSGQTPPPPAKIEAVKQQEVRGRTKSWCVPPSNRDTNDNKDEKPPMEDAGKSTPPAKDFVVATDQPAWIAMANRKSKRASQILQDGNTTSEQDSGEIQHS